MTEATYELIRTRNAKIAQLTAENAALKAKVQELDKVCAMVPKPPDAITWEHGVSILNALQKAVHPHQPTRKEPLTTYDEPTIFNYTGEEPDK